LTDQISVYNFKMTKPTRSRRFRIRFELSVAGLLGLCVVAFCIFLWMFLMGIWAGQTVLLPEGNRPGMVVGLAELWPKGGEEPVKPPAEVVAPFGIDAGNPVLDAEYGEASFFSLQVAAYSEAAHAGKAAAEWRHRGLDAFFLAPVEGGDGLYRVCVGKFESLAEANREAGRLEEDEDIRAFIALVSATNVQI
jgi:hypothetical protein